MNGFAQAAAGRLMGLLPGRFLPEQRKIELYTHGLEVSLADPGPPEGPPGWDIPPVMDALVAFMLLEAQLETSHPGLAELPWGQRQAALAPRDRVQRVMAQVYRILRLLRRGVAAPGARLKNGEGVFQLNYVERPFAFGLRVTHAGLELLASLVALYLDLLRQPYPEAYLEALLSQYYEDIITEVRYLSDEEGSVLHFRKEMAFNRHCRLRCGNARFVLGPQHLEVAIGERFADPRAYPIDFFLLIEGEFHIIPAEALETGRLPRAELERWRARPPQPEHGGPAFDLRLRSEARDPGPMA